MHQVELALRRIRRTRILNAVINGALLALVVVIALVMLAVIMHSTPSEWVEPWQR